MKKNPIYKAIFMYHVNAIELCNIRQCLGLISEEKVERTNARHCMGAIRAAHFGGFGSKEIEKLFEDGSQ